MAETGPIELASPHPVVHESKHNGTVGDREMGTEYDIAKIERVYRLVFWSLHTVGIAERAPQKARPPHNTWYDYLFHSNPNTLLRQHSFLGSLLHLLCNTLECWALSDNERGTGS